MLDLHDVSCHRSESTVVLFAVSVRSITLAFDIPCRITLSFSKGSTNYRNWNLRHQLSGLFFGGGGFKTYNFFSKSQCILDISYAVGPTRMMYR
jgi:hypothetical protein